MKQKVLRVFNVMLAMAMMIFLLAGCGKEDDSNNPNLGLYTAFTGSMSGIEIEIADVYAGGFTIELKANGKAQLVIDGTTGKGKWTLEGNKFTISGGGFEGEGTLKDGVMILENVMGSGLTVTLVNEAFLKSLSEDAGEYDFDEDIEAGFADETMDNAVPGLTDDMLAEDSFDTSYAAKWEGTWFGWFWFDECTGKFIDSADSLSACYLVLEFDDEKTGTFEVSNSWYTFGSGDFEIDGDLLKVTSGLVFDSPINTDNWIFVPIPGYEPEITMADEIVDDDGDKLTFSMFLKPWGYNWDEMETSNMYEKIFKPYKEKVAAGENPPYGFANPTYDPRYEGDYNELIDGSAGASTSGSSSKSDMGYPIENTVDLSINTQKLDFKNHGELFFSYPANYSYRDDYDKLSRDDDKVSVTLNPLLGANGVDEWKESLEKNYKGEYSDYKLEETTIHGYKALVCQYDDWGCVVKVVIDFGNDAIPNGYYGMQFDINGDDWKDCYSDDVWAIIYGFENKK